MEFLARHDRLQPGGPGQSGWRRIVLLFRGELISLRGRIDLFGTDAPIDMLARLGVGVRLVVKLARSRKVAEGVDLKTLW